MENISNNQELNLPDSLVGPVDDWLARNAGNDDVLAVLGADPGNLSMLRKVLACSPYAADIIERRPDVFRELVDSGRLARPLVVHEVRDLFADAAADGPAEPEFERRLRWLRHRELVRIIWRDLAGVAEVAETLVELSAVADAAICAGITWAQSVLEARHGKPRSVDGPVASIVVLAMGKLGGRELNFSSSIFGCGRLVTVGRSLSACRLSKLTWPSMAVTGNATHTSRRGLLTTGTVRRISTTRSCVRSFIGVTWITAFSVRYAT
jgi:glutamine synthetase adenylyltransferase